jgi:hypothetical protein
LRTGCLAIFEKEKAEGTELPAIIQLLQDHVEREEERLLEERRERYQQIREAEQIAREQRLLMGADCGWTQQRTSQHWYCRINGRTYRLSPTPDKKWSLSRVNSVAESEEGVLIGKYQGRGDATKIIKQIAYQPELRWR